MKRSLLLFLALLAFGLSVVLAQNPVKVRIGFNPTQNSDQLRPAAQAIADYLLRCFRGVIEAEIFTLPSNLA